MRRRAVSLSASPTRVLWTLLTSPVRPKYNPTAHGWRCSRHARQPSARHFQPGRAVHLSSQPHPTEAFGGCRSSGATARPRWSFSEDEFRIPLRSFWIPKPRREVSPSCRTPITRPRLPNDYSAEPCAGANVRPAFPLKVLEGLGRPIHAPPSFPAHVAQLYRSAACRSREHVIYGD